MANKIAVIVFLAFGLLNLNDPDWYLWTPMYFITAAIIFSKTKNKLTLNIFYLLVIVLVVLSLTGTTALDKEVDSMVGMVENKREAIGGVFSICSVWFFSRK